MSPFAPSAGIACDAVDQTRVISVTAIRPTNAYRISYELLIGTGVGHEEPCATGDERLVTFVREVEK